MLDPILYALNQIGVNASADDVDINVVFSIGKTVSANVKVGGKGFYYIKLTRFDSLSDEAYKNRAARDIHGQVVPDVLGSMFIEPWSIIVFESVDFRPVEATDFMSKRMSRELFLNLVNFFESSKVGILRGFEKKQRSLLFSEVVQFLNGGDWCPRGIVEYTKRCEDGFGQFIFSVPQHGDFVLNNLGYIKNRGLVVFDWEDYGEIDLPGFDLFMICMSIGGMRSEVAVGIRSGETVFQGFIQDVCLRIDLDYQLFREMTLLYAIVFLFLKRNYGERISEISKAIVLGLAADYGYC